LKLAAFLLFGQLGQWHILGVSQVTLATTRCGLGVIEQIVFFHNIFSFVDHNLDIDFIRSLFQLLLQQELRLVERLEQITGLHLIQVFPIVISGSNLGVVRGRIQRISLQHGVMRIVISRTLSSTRAGTTHGNGLDINFLFMRGSAIHGIVVPRATRFHDFFLRDHEFVDPHLQELLRLFEIHRPPLAMLTLRRHHGAQVLVGIDGCIVGDSFDVGRLLGPVAVFDPMGVAWDGDRSDPSDRRTAGHGIHGSDSIGHSRGDEGRFS